MERRTADQQAAPTAASIRVALENSAPRNTSEWRALRRGWSRALKGWPATDVIELGAKLVDLSLWGRLTAYELIACHPSGVASLTSDSIRRLGDGLADWNGVDTFACYLAGPAWREGRLATRQVHAWLRSSDRWQRRTAVVCTVALNVPARGGSGDVDKTLEVCRRVVGDRDDMVVKAVSWALRSLIQWDRAAVARFVKTHGATLAPRVKREVGNKLRTGQKNPQARDHR